MNASMAVHVERRPGSVRSPFYVGEVVAVATKGDSFRPGDETHAWTDTLRYAQWIQAARDERRFSDADAMREWVARMGLRVSQDKTSTTVREEWRGRKTGLLLARHLAYAWRRAALLWALHGPAVPGADPTDAAVWGLWGASFHRAFGRTHNFNLGPWRLTNDRRGGWTLRRKRPTASGNWWHA